MRKRIEVLCRMLANIYGLESLTLTTNGVLLREMALPLFEAGLRRINVSLDTLNPQRFKRITGRNLLSEVICGINKAEDIGFYPIKINTVVMRGVNDDEVQDLARLTLRKPYHVRFIELMPIGGFSIEAHRSLFVPVEEIFNAVKKIGVWSLQRRTGSCGPARLCTLRDAAGSVGFIAPISWHFCYSCNRMRLTADGKLRPCLFSEEEIDIKEPLRAGASIEELADIFVLATTRKPRGYLMEKVDLKIGLGRAMQAIGG